MQLLIWLIIILVFIYSAGLSMILWKTSNKPGSIAVFVLALAVIVVPFFSVL